MDSDDELEGIGYWSDLMNERGHAPAFARNNKDKSVVELATAREWAQSVQAKYGLRIDDLESNPERNGVPDCFANLDGKRFGIELTELVDGSLLRKIDNARKTGREVSAYSGEGFRQSQWDQDRFLKDLSKLICSKITKYRQNVHVVDVLVVHSDEPWLKPECVEQWLLDCKLEPTVQIKSAYLLMSYVPGYSENWPVLRIF